HPERDLVPDRRSGVRGEEPRPLGDAREFARRAAEGALHQPRPRATGQGARERGGDADEASLRRVGDAPRAAREALCDLLREQRRDSVADLLLRGATRANELVVVGECLQPLDLGEAQAPVVPVERPDVRAGLRLNRRRWLRGVELEQEAPVALAPPEERFRVAALLGEEEVVVARRDGGQQMAVLAADDLLCLREVVAL